MHEQHFEQQADQVLAEQQALARLAIIPCYHIVNIAIVHNPVNSTHFFTTDEEDLRPFFDVVTLPIPPPSARAIVRSLCSALGHLHGHDIIHRDIKPENLLVPPEGLEGQLKLTGFANASLQPTSLSYVGTPEYMAPEIMRADTGAYTDVVDWWSLGCLTSELLTGTTPFHMAGADVPTLLRMILWDPITVPTHSHVGPLERDFIMALLKRNPSARLGGQGHTAVLAHPWFLPSPPSPPPPSPPPPLPPPPSPPPPTTVGVGVGD